MYTLKYGTSIDDCNTVGVFESEMECFKEIGEIHPNAPYLRMWGNDIITVDYGMHNSWYYIFPYKESKNNG